MCDVDIPLRTGGRHIKILVICEGDEEVDFVNRLKAVDVWSKNFDVFTINAGGIGNLSWAYNYWRSNNKYNVIVILCDTEDPPYKQFEQQKIKIWSCVPKKKKSEISWNQIIFYGNPNTMRVILLNFGQWKQTTNSKTANSKKINEHSGRKDIYDADKRQRESLMNKINAESYKLMMDTLKKSGVDRDYTVTGATNIDFLFEGLEGNKPNWPDCIIF